MLENGCLLPNIYSQVFLYKDEYIRMMGGADIRENNSEKIFSIFVFVFVYYFSSSFIVL